MIGGNIIRKRVLAIINEKINEKQKDYDEKSKIIDNKCTTNISIKKAEIKEFIKTQNEKKIKDKTILLDEIVQSIIGKVI